MSISNGPIAPKTAVNGIGGPMSSDLESIDGLESFVVLERETANEASQDQLSLGIRSIPPFSYQPFGAHFAAQQPTIISPSMLSNHSSQGMSPFSQATANATFENTNVSVGPEEIEKRLQEVLLENINLKDNLYQTNLAMKQQLNTVSLLQDRALESQKRQQAKFEETKALILKLSSEKTELQEANNLMTAEFNKFKGEYVELKETNIAFGAEAAQLLKENADLKKQLSSVQESLQSLSDSNRKTSLQLQQPTAKEKELLELVEGLTRKLETVERARRQQEFDIERLQAQLGRTTLEHNEAQRKLAHTEQALQVAKLQVSQTEENSLTDSLQDTTEFGKRLMNYEAFVKQLKTSVQEEQTKLNSLCSWLSLTDPAAVNSTQFEISELRHLLVEEQAQSVTRKEHLYQAVTVIQELLANFKGQGKELEKVKASQAVQESHSHVYDEMKRKGYTEKIDELTALLVQKEEALTVSERHFASLQEAVRLQNEEKKTGEGNPELAAQIKDLTKKVEAREEKLKENERELDTLKEQVLQLRQLNDSIPILNEQAKVYFEDFEAERKARELLVAEKERLLEDLRHLQRRNQELMDQLNQTRNQLVKERSPPGNQRPALPTVTSTPTAPRPQDDPVPPPKRFYCPNPDCNMMFTTLDPLQLHVITCLKLDD